MTKILDMVFVKNANLITKLDTIGYQHLTYIKDKGICGIQRFIYTTALLYDLNDIGYSGRYCFNTYKEALQALNDWQIHPELQHPPGNWIKHKGTSEFSNPEYIKE